MSQSQRKLLTSLTLAVILLASLSLYPLHADTTATLWIVNTLTDEADGSCADGDCALRDALSLAQPGDTISLTVTGTLTLNEALTITTPVDLLGPGAEHLSLSGGNVAPVLRVLTGSVSLRGLTVRDGHAESGYGGGLYVDAPLSAGVLWLTETAFISNTALRGGGVYVAEGGVYLQDSLMRENSATDSLSQGGGGGVYLAGAGAVLTQSGWLTLSHNRAARDGAGVFINEGRASLKGVHLQENHAENDGGGIFVRAGRLTVTATASQPSQFLHNTATDGGGLFLQDGEAYLQATAINQNQASDYGGGLFVQSGQLTLSGGQLWQNQATLDGGAVYLMEATASLSQSGATQVSQNSAGVDGGGFYISAGQAVLSGAQVASNTARYGGGVFVSESEVALSDVNLQDNTAQRGGGLYVLDGRASLSAGVIGRNQASDRGGGVFNLDGWFGLHSGQIISNTAPLGGGLNVAFGEAALQGGQILSNTADVGGGVRLNFGRITLTDTLISHNRAITEGGGVYLAASNARFNQTGGAGRVSQNEARWGGGLFINRGTVHLQDSLISQNTAQLAGGVFVARQGAALYLTATQVMSNAQAGVLVQAGSARVQGGQVSGNGLGVQAGWSNPFNESGSLVVQNSLISQNMQAGAVYSGNEFVDVSLTLGGSAGAANVFEANGGRHVWATAPASRAPVEARFNDWGVVSLAEIEGQIEHQFDDSAVAWVQYYGLELTASPPIQPADGLSAIGVVARLSGLLTPPNGETLHLQTTRGQLSQASGPTDATQSLSSTLTSSWAGPAVVSLWAGADVNARYVVTTAVTFSQTDQVRVYLPLILRNAPSKAILLGQAQEFQSLSQAGVITGQIYYTHTVTLPQFLPSGGRFYLSSQPDAVSEVLVDDRLLLDLNGSPWLTVNFGSPLGPKMVALPADSGSQLAGATMRIRYQDVFGRNLGARSVWLVWEP